MLKSVVHDGQTAIPSDVMTMLSLKEGQELTWVMMPDRSIVLRAKNRPITDLDGMLPTPKQAVSIDEMRL
ncbi:AbrB/MazE/SpoVT family DNA-binding domain-containing protein [Moraxella boevrei]|uniref:AbrB/MazE/SpoVT family DNA-binding domain-containing protein n=1 Tax=Faucicola boevrei TaxID=346665 RepID=UPI0037353103